MPSPCVVATLRKEERQMDSDRVTLCIPVGLPYQLIYRQVWSAGKVSGVEAHEGFFLCRTPFDGFAQGEALAKRFGVLDCVKTILKLCTRTRLLYGIKQEKAIVHTAWVTIGECRYYNVEREAVVIGPVFTDEMWRGKGLAAAAARQAMAILSAGRDRIFYIDTSDSNTASQRFIAKSGFGLPIAVYIRSSKQSFGHDTGAT